MMVRGRCAITKRLITSYGNQLGVDTELYGSQMMKVDLLRGDIFFLYSDCDHENNVSVLETYQDMDKLPSLAVLQKFKI